LTAAVNNADRRSDRCLKYYPGAAEMILLLKYIKEFNENSERVDAKHQKNYVVRNSNYEIPIALLCLWLDQIGILENNVKQNKFITARLLYFWQKIVYKGFHLDFNILLNIQYVLICVWIIDDILWKIKHHSTFYWFSKYLQITKFGRFSAIECEIQRVP
jgi:hypothetical protein